MLQVSILWADGTMTDFYTKGPRHLRTMLDVVIQEKEWAEESTNVQNVWIGMAMSPKKCGVIFEAMDRVSPEENCINQIESVWGNRG